MPTYGYVINYCYARCCYKTIIILTFGKEINYFNKLSANNTIS